jgi:release factor glutamine methyltransferase
VPVSPTPAEQDALVRRLRAAGCVFAEDEAALLLAEAPDAAALEAMAARRVAGDPLEQVLGWAEFCGLRVAVAPGVFVPRRRTELLARTAIDLLAAAADRGTGAVGAAVLAALPGVEVWACDLDPSATACTERNLPGPAAAGRVRTGDLAAPLPADLRGRVDVLTANAPYVPTAAIALMPPEAREHEPGLALDGGADGVDLHRRVAALAPGWLRPGGHLLIETSTRQADATVAACAAHGLTARVLRDEDLDATVVHATA